MERTTIYLDAVLKRRLKDAAARSGRSEAGLIREALDRYPASISPAALVPVGRASDGGVASDVDSELERRGFGRSWSSWTPVASWPSSIEGSRRTRRAGRRSGRPRGRS